MESLLNTKDISIKCGEEMEFKVVVEEDLEDGGYIVRCPALKRCWSHGGYNRRSVREHKRGNCWVFKNIKREGDALY